MKKNGFMATSLIYSFFLVFLLLMISLLAKDVSNRILLKAMKDEIRSDFEEDKGFVIDKLKSDTYNVGSVVSFAGENWQVMKDKGASIVLILQRTLTRGEIANALGLNIQTTDRIYYGTCDEISCQVRSCREVPAFNPENPPVGIYGRENCFYDPRNPTQYIKASWLPTTTQVESQGYGQKIPSTIVTNWFKSHSGLQRALNLGKLNPLVFDDGFLHYDTSRNIYVRIPLQSEVQEANSSSWASIGQPFHILSNMNTLQPYQVHIYGPSLRLEFSNVTAFIRPVIEVKEG